MSMIIFRNGQFVPEQEAGVSPLDRGFLYGDGVFETLRCYEGKFFRLPQHVERMRAGLERLGIAAPAWLDEAAGILHVLVTRNGVTGGAARIVVTRGVGEFGLLGKQATEPLMIAACWNQPPPACQALWSSSTGACDTAANVSGMTNRCAASVVTTRG